MSEFKISVQADEEQLARAASEQFIRAYRLVLEDLVKKSFEEGGDGRKKVAEALQMRLASDRTTLVIAENAGKMIEFKAAEASKSFLSSEEFDKNVIKQVTEVVHCQHQDVLEKLVLAHFEKDGPAWKKIDEIFQMKAQSENLLRIIANVTNALIESKVTKSVSAFINENESLIASFVEPKIREAIDEVADKLDVRAKLESCFDQVIMTAIQTVATESAKNLIGDVVREKVQNALPHAAVPHVGKIVDQLPFEAILRHWVKSNAVLMSSEILQRLTKNLSEKRLKTLFDSVLSELEIKENHDAVISVSEDQRQIIISFVRHEIMEQ